MYRLSAWFLVPAAGNLLGGYWYTTTARSAPPNLSPGLLAGHLPA
jgi:hypothetical protein